MTPLYQSSDMLFACNGNDAAWPIVTSLMALSLFSASWIDLRYLTGGLSCHCGTRATLAGLAGAENTAITFRRLVSYL